MCVAHLTSKRRSNICSSSSGIRSSSSRGSGSARSACSGRRSSCRETTPSRSGRQRFTDTSTVGHSLALSDISVVDVREIDVSVASEESTPIVSRSCLAFLCSDEGEGGCCSIMLSSLSKFSIVMLLLVISAVRERSVLEIISAVAETRLRSCVSRVVYSKTEARTKYLHRFCTYIRGMDA
jgi:hypothetical protein